eukprot:359710-Chlamydomonas_euryale.AAC.6
MGAFLSAQRRLGGDSDLGARAACRSHPKTGDASCPGGCGAIGEPSPFVPPPIPMPCPLLYAARRHAARQCAGHESGASAAVGGRRKRATPCRLPGDWARRDRKRGATVLFPERGRSAAPSCGGTRTHRRRRALLASFLCRSH